MASIRTNRDLYLALADLSAKTDAGDRGLEEYLRALWGLARAYRDRTALSGDELLGLLARALTEPAPPFDEGWRAAYERDFAPAFAPLPPLAAWEARVLRQVVDLREMDEQGSLRNELRYLGIDSPRGARWYNFDPTTFLECAAVGTFGGWEGGDDRPLPALSWDVFRDFLNNGQSYE